MVDYSGFNYNNNYVIPPEFYARAKTDMITAFRRQNIARSVMPVRPVGGGIGVQQWNWSHASEMSEATLSWGFTQTNEDQISMSRQSTKIPVLHKEFKLDRRDLATAALGGYDMTTKNISAASYQLAYLENKIALDGYKRQDGTYEVEGLYQLAKTTITDDLPLSTYGNTVKAVKLAKNALADKELYGTMNLIMNDQDYTELVLSQTEYGKDEEPRVQKLLGGSILGTYWQPKGTMMMVPTNDIGAVEMLITQDVSMDTEIENKTKDLWGQIYECLTIVAYWPDHIVKFTNVGSP